MAGAQEAITALTMIRELNPIGPPELVCQHPAEALEHLDRTCEWWCSECWAAVPDEHVVDRMKAEASL